MNLHAIVLSAILSLVAKLSPDVRAKIAAGAPERYAEDIVAAVDGTDHPLEYALASVANQAAESDFRESVETCRVVGDGGAAISSFQLHRFWWRGRARDEMCHSNALAAELEVKTLVALHARAKSWRATFRYYVGASRQDDPRMRKRDKNFEALMKEFGGVS